MTKVPDLSLIGTAARDDLLHVVDVSDLTHDPSGTSRNIPFGYFEGGPGSVLKFGADPTGATDSTAAFQAAYDANASPYVPIGKYRVNGTIICDRPGVWQFEQGHIPTPNWFIAPGSWPFDDTAGRGVTLFKDEGSSNIPFFKIRDREVHIRGYPRCDVSGRTTFNAGIVHYALGETNTVANSGRTDIWGGEIEIIVTGNYSSLSTVGNGAKCIHATWDNASNFGALTQQRWRVIAINVAYGAYLEAQDPLLTTYSNNIIGRFDITRCKQVVFNDCSTGCYWIGRVQNAGSMALSEAPKAAVHLTENAASNTVDVEVYDASQPLVADGNGEYGISYLCQNDARNTRIIRTWSGGDSLVANQIPTGPGEMFYAPIGVVPWGGRDAGTGFNSLLLTALNNNFANASVRCTTYSYGVYDGTAVAESDTAVSDLTFTNASAESIDVTSPLGAIPAYSVGAIFTVSGAPDSENNGDFMVTAAITNGYTCDKLGETVTAGSANYNRVNPINATAAAATVTDGIGAIVTDSVTASIATSSEWTETRSFSELTKSYGQSPVATFTQAAIDDEDYIEFVWDGLTLNAQRMYVSIIGDGGFKRLQLIRSLSGAVVDNNIVIGTRSADQEQAGLDRLFISGGNADKHILRCWGPRTTKPLTFDDICTTPSDRDAIGHLMTQLGGHTIENSNTLRGGGWDEAHVIVGNIHIFTNASNEVRASIGAPTSSSDGALIGTAT